MSDMQVRGPLFGGTGTPSPFTAGRSGASRVQDAHGRYYDAAVENRLLWLDSGAVTIAAANVTGAALGTLAFINGFYNPVGSGVIASVRRVVQATVSGTPGGPLLYNFVVPGARVASTPTGSWRPSNLSTMLPAKTALVPLVNVVLSTIPADTTTVGTACGVAGGPAAVAAGAGVYSAADELDGSIQIPPGTAWGLVASAAGTTHIVRTAICVEEVAQIA